MPGRWPRHGTGARTHSQAQARREPERTLARRAAAPRLGGVTVSDPKITVIMIISAGPRADLVTSRPHPSGPNRPPSGPVVN